MDRDLALGVARTGHAELAGREMQRPFAPGIRGLPFEHDPEPQLRGLFRGVELNVREERGDHVLDEDLGRNGFGREGGNGGHAGPLGFDGP